MAEEEDTQGKEEEESAWERCAIGLCTLRPKSEGKGL